MVLPSEDLLVQIANSPFPKLSLHAFYAAAAKQTLSTTDSIPFLIPGTFFGCFLVPSFFLAFSWKKHPWLKPLRYVVFLLVTLINWDAMRRSTSTNVACGYGNGMTAVWGTLVAGMVLVFLDGQDVERIAKRMRKRGKKDDDDSGEVVEYYWQSYPHDGTFYERYLWGFDMVTSLRGAGWSWAIPSPLSPLSPSKPHTEEVVDMGAMLIVSKSGFHRCRTRREFWLKTIPVVLVGYLGLDFLSILVEMDPFFMLGHRGRYPPFEYPPPHLSWIPASFLRLYQELFFLTCIGTAIHVVFSWIDIIQYSIFSSLFPLRGEPWQYTPIFGPISAIVESGLGGLWGTTWHQTFRVLFTAPVRWIWGPGRGRFPGKKMALLFTAFFSSGLMHSGASYTAVPTTKYEEPLYFFLAQGLGVAIQRGIAKVLRPMGLPSWLRKMGNVLFVLGWLYWSAMLLGDDFATGGIWMLEPSPYSILRAWGYGAKGDSPWRWHGGTWGDWFVGKHVWEIGWGI